MYYLQENLLHAISEAIPRVWQTPRPIFELGDYLQVVFTLLFTFVPTLIQKKNTVTFFPPSIQNPHFFLCR